MPCLEAAGLEVLVDRERFRAGRPVSAEIEYWQGRAEHHLVVLSPSYLESPYCRQEMERAVGLDPSLAQGLAVPVLREHCTVPEEIRPALYADPRDDGAVDPWEALFRGLGVELRCSAPDLLAARDQVLRHLGRGESVNLLVRGAAPWRQLLDHLKGDHFPHLGAVDLDRGSAVPRRGLVEEILGALGRPTSVSEADGEDLLILGRRLGSGPRSLLALLHFDHAARRPDYGVDLFGSIRHLVMDQRQLQLLVHSRTPFAELVPRDHPLSAIDLKTVELPGRA